MKQKGLKMQVEAILMNKKGSTEHSEPIRTLDPVK